MEGRESSSDPNAAKEAFRKHYADLIRALQDPEVLACELFSKEVVSETIMDEVGHVALTGIQKKMKLLSAVRDQLAVAPEKLKTVLEAFRKLPSLCEIARKVDATYCTLIGTSPHEEHNPVEQPSSPITQSTGSNCPPPKRQKMDPNLTRATTSQDLGSPMDTYAAYLKSVYAKQKLPAYDRLSEVDSKRYINLAVIEKEEVSKEKAGEFTRATIHGNIDDIKRKKKAIELHDIGQLPDGSRPKCILVEGAPGVGKSTFSWKLCRKWGKGKILQQYKLVVLLRLRDTGVREAKRVSDLFRYYKRQVQRAVVEEIEESGGEGILLLFEGYDELPAKLRTEDSIFLQIIKGELLPEATVLITSRPVASEYLLTKCKNHISQRIEILGFTQENIQSYLESTTGGDPSLLSGLKQYLSCYPHIRSMVYNPLNCAIVVKIYKMNRKDNVTIPKTLTELYSSLIRSLLLRYLREHPHYGKKRISSFSDLPPDVHKQLCELGRIAYEGIANDQQVIFSDLPEGFETLDLMQCVPELYVDEGAVLSYNFLHLTIQEYMAAFYLSQQPVTTQMEYFREYADVDSSSEEEESESSSDLSENDHSTVPQCDNSDSDSQRSDSYQLETLSPGEVQNMELIPILELGDSLPSNTRESAGLLLPQNIDHFQMVLRFLAGLSHFRNYPPNAMTPVFLQTEQRYDRERDCEASSEHVTLEALHWTFEAQDNDIFEASVSSPAQFHVGGDYGEYGVEYDLTHFNGDVNQFIHHMTHFDYFVLGHCISHNKCTWSIHFEDVFVPEAVEMLVQGVLEGATPCKGGISELKFSECEIPILKHLVSIPREIISSLEVLKLYRCGLGSEDYVLLVQLLSSLPMLKKLYLDVRTDGARTLADALCVNTSLQELDLSWNGGIGSDGASALADALRVNTSLQKLNLSYNGIGPDGACTLAEALCKNTSLQELDLSKNAIGDRGASAFAKVILQNKSLRKLHLRGDTSISIESAQNLIDSLTANSTLQHYTSPYGSSLESSETYQKERHRVSFWS